MHTKTYTIIKNLFCFCLMVPCQFPLSVYFWIVVVWGGYALSLNVWPQFPNPYTLFSLKNFPCVSYINSAESCSLRKGDGLHWIQHVDMTLDQHFVCRFGNERIPRDVICGEVRIVLKKDRTPFPPGAYSPRSGFLLKDCSWSGRRDQYHRDPFGVWHYTEDGETVLIFYFNL